MLGVESSAQFPQAIGVAGRVSPVHTSPAPLNGGQVQQELRFEIRPDNPEDAERVAGTSFVFSNLKFLD